MASIFFKSAEHKGRFVAAMQKIGKVYADGRMNSEYAAALYILTADFSTWEKTKGYVDSDSIDFSAILEEVDFGGGYSVLIKLAGNLFNSLTLIDPIEFLRLDEGNFNVALSSLKVRRYGMRVDDFKS